MSYIYFPQDISDKWLYDTLSDNKIPAMYPDNKFLNEHYEITESYRKYIDFYKKYGYEDINKYLLTGEGDKKTKEYTENLIVLYDKVKPLPYDMVVYRGSNFSIGQDFKTASCVKAGKINPEDNKYNIKCTNMINLKLTTKKGISADSIYENLSFFSTTTDIHTAISFTNDSSSSTLIAFILKAGTKFICPVSEFQSNDREKELILFPMHNSFILTGKVKTTILKTEHTIYTGVCLLYTSPSPRDRS